MGGEVCYYCVTYGSVRNAAFYHCFCFRVDGNLTGAIDHAVADDGLRIDGERRGSFLGLYCDFCRHDDGGWSYWGKLDVVKSYKCGRRDQGRGRK